MTMYVSKVWGWAPASWPVIMKIGWAKDPVLRAAKLSEPLAPGLTGEQWRLVRHQRWADDRIAYAMEQRFIEAIEGQGARVKNISR